MITFKELHKISMDYLHWTWENLPWLLMAPIYLIPQFTAYDFTNIVVSTLHPCLPIPSSNSSHHLQDILHGNCNVFSSLQNVSTKPTNDAE